MLRTPHWIFPLRDGLRGQSHQTSTVLLHDGENTSIISTEDQEGIEYRTYYMVTPQSETEAYALGDRWEMHGKRDNNTLLSRERYIIQVTETCTEPVPEPEPVIKAQCIRRDHLAENIVSEAQATANLHGCSAKGKTIHSNQTIGLWLGF